MPLNSMKIDHALAIGDVWLDMVLGGGLKYFVYEPKDEFNPGTGRRVYCPDAFFIHGGTAYLLEVQRSPLSTKRWAEKWAVASQYFDGGYYKSASWQVAQGRIIKPSIVVLSTQSPQVITAGTGLSLILAKDIKEALC